MLSDSTVAAGKPSYFLHSSSDLQEEDEQAKQLVSPETEGSQPMLIFKSVQVFSCLFLKCLAGNTSVPHIVQTFKPIFTLPELQRILPVEGVMI